MTDGLRARALPLWVVATVAALMGTLPAGAQQPRAILDGAVADFEAGRIAESVAAFDEVVRMVPDQAPFLWQRGIALYYVGRLPDGRLPNAFTPAYLRGDVRLGWRPSSALEISVGAQNAFDPSHGEMISSSLQRLVEVPRNVYGSVTWRF